MTYIHKKTASHLYKKVADKRLNVGITLTLSSARKLRALGLKCNKNRSEVVEWLLQPFPDPAETVHP